MRSIARIALTLLAATSVAFGGQIPGYAASPIVNNDTERSPRVTPDPTLPAFAATFMAQKAKLAEHYAVAQRTWNWNQYNADVRQLDAVYGLSLVIHSDRSATGASIASCPSFAHAPTLATTCYTSHSVPLYQQPQTTSYYCGPASASEVIGQLGVSISQSSAAPLLSTTTNGTNWSMSPSNENSALQGNYRTGYPIPDVVNYKINLYYYGPVAVPYYPGSADYSSYQSRLGVDIDQGYSLVGDAEEVYNGPHLVGHPNFQTTIYHWFGIKGYTSSGGNTTYADSVYSAPAVSWYQSVPNAYSTLSSNTIVNIVGDRGYVW